MKTFTKTTVEESPLLEIKLDDDCPSPREDTNLGYFITKECNHNSPDGENRIGNDDYQPSWFLKDIIKETGEIADDQKDHMKKIKEKFEGDEGDGDKIIAIYPIYKYEHGGVSYRLGSAYGFDNSNCGFYIITNKTQKETGVIKKNFKKVIEQELENYNQWVNGEMYMFFLYDNEGDMVECIGGFYNIEDIHDHLPQEWKKEDLNEYFNN